MSTLAIRNLIDIGIGAVETEGVLRRLDSAGYVIAPKQPTPRPVPGDLIDAIDITVAPFGVNVNDVMEAIDRSGHVVVSKFLLERVAKCLRFTGIASHVELAKDVDAVNPKAMA